MAAFKRANRGKGPNIYQEPISSLWIHPLNYLQGKAITWREKRQPSVERQEDAVKCEIRQEELLIWNQILIKRKQRTGQGSSCARGLVFDLPSPPDAMMPTDVVFAGGFMFECLLPWMREWKKEEIQFSFLNFFLIAHTNTFRRWSQGEGGEESRRTKRKDENRKRSSIWICGLLTVE